MQGSNGGRKRAGLRHSWEGEGEKDWEGGTEARTLPRVPWMARGYLLRAHTHGSVTTRGWDGWAVEGGLGRVCVCVPVADSC